MFLRRDSEALLRLLRPGDSLSFFTGWNSRDTVVYLDREEVSLASRQIARGALLPTYPARLFVSDTQVLAAGECK